MLRKTVKVNGIDGKQYLVEVGTIKYGVFRRIKEGVLKGEIDDAETDNLIVWNSIISIKDVETGEEVADVRNFMMENLDMIEALKVEEAVAEVNPFPEATGKRS